MSNNLEPNLKNEVWKFRRKKKSRMFNSIIYRITRYLPIRRSTKFMLFSEMSWFFKRISFENANFGRDDDYIPWIAKKNFFLNMLKSHYKVVDIGCGEGHFSRMIAPNVHSVIGVDYDEKLIELAKSLTDVKNISFINNDVFLWFSKSSEKLDVGLCSHVVEHLDDPSDFLRKSKKLFKLIFFEVPDSDQSEHSYLRVLNGLDPIYSDDDHIWEFKRVDILKIFENLELEIIEHEYIHGVMRFWLKS